MSVLNSSLAWFAAFVVVMGVLFVTGRELMEASIVALLLVGGAYVAYELFS